MDKKIITRAEAKSLGLKRYFTGKPCKHGHVSDRQVSDKTCIECKSINFKVEYVYKYRAKNPEMAKRTAEKQYAKNREKLLDKAKKLYANTKAEYEAYMDDASRRKWEDNEQ